MADTKEDENKYQVLEFFGIPIKVKSKNVAEVLTMDAKEALKSDIKDLKDKLSPIEEAGDEEIEEEIEEVTEEELDWKDYIDTKRFGEVVGFIGKNLGFLINEDNIWSNKRFEKMAILPLSKKLDLEILRQIFNSLEKYLKENNLLSAIIISSNETIGGRVEKALYTLGHSWPIRSLNYQDLVKINKLKETNKINDELMMILFSPHYTNNVGKLLTLITNPQEIISS